MMMITEKKREGEEVFTFMYMYKKERIEFAAPSSAALLPQHRTTIIILVQCCIHTLSLPRSQKFLVPLHL